MNEQNFKKRLNEGAENIPEISLNLKSSIADYVSQHKDEPVARSNRSWFYSAVALVTLSVCAWALIANADKEKLDVQPIVNYERIFSNAKLPKISIPVIKTPKVDIVVSDKMGEVLLAFLNDKTNNPYENEIKSFAKLSKRIANNFSDELMLGHFKQQN